MGNQERAARQALTAEQAASALPMAALPHTLPTGKRIEISYRCVQVCATETAPEGSLAQAKRSRSDSSITSMLWDCRRIKRTITRMPVSRVWVSSLRRNRVLPSRSSSS